MTLSFDKPDQAPQFHKIWKALNAFKTENPNIKLKGLFEEKNSEQLKTILNKFQDVNLTQSKLTEIRNIIGPVADKFYEHPYKYLRKLTGVHYLHRYCIEMFPDQIHRNTLNNSKKPKDMKELYNSLFKDQRSEKLNAITRVPVFNNFVRLIVTESWPKLLYFLDDYRDKKLEQFAGDQQTNDKPGLVLYELLEIFETKVGPVKKKFNDCSFKK